MQAYAIAAGHRQTAQAAATVLQQGGNAFDAVLAAMMMSFVAEPLLSSPGGGGFLLAAGPQQKPKILDFFSNTPQLESSGLTKDDWDFYPISGDFGDRSQEFYVGRAAAAVPGVVAGIYQAHDKLASLPLTQLAAPAIKAASQGIKVNARQAYVADILTPIIASTTQAKQLFKNFSEGAVWKNIQLADFLDTLSRSSVDWFYRGEPAHSIYDSSDCLLQATDFNHYQCQIREPLSMSINGYKVFTNPEPSTGGRLIVEQLKHSSKQHNRAEPSQEIFAAMVQMEQHKDKLLNAVSRGTSHISVADKYGNLAALTLSNGEGNGHIVPGCGFMMNNFLGESDINSEGLFKWQSGQRMRSMMAPTLIVHPKVSYALGSGGSNRIKTALFQVIYRLIHQQALLKTAVESPRMHFENAHLDLEPGFSATQKTEWQRQCEVTEWQQANLYFGGVNAVQTGQELAAIGDFRRHGSGLVGILK